MPHEVYDSKLAPKIRIKASDEFSLNLFTYKTSFLETRVLNNSQQLCNIYTEKPVPQRFVQMVSKNPWWWIPFGLSIYHFLINSQFSERD